jgi:hypothetical protein
MGEEDEDFHWLGKIRMLTEAGKGEGYFGASRSYG